MNLSIRGDIGLAGAAIFRAACASGAGTNPNLIAVTNEGRIRVYSLSPSITLLASANAPNTTTSDISFVAPSTAVLTSQGTSNVYLVDTNTLYVRTISSGTTTSNQNFYQQVAGDISTGIAIATSSTVGTVQVIRNSAATCTSITPQASGGWTSGSEQARCVIFKADTSTWLIGTNLGKVYEISTTGHILNSISVPVTFAGTAVTQISSLSYTSPYLLVATIHGTINKYTWPSATLVDSRVAPPGYPIISNSFSSNGNVLVCQGPNVGTSTSYTQAVDCVSYSAYKSAISVDQTFYNQTTVSVNSCGVIGAQGLAYAAFNTATGVCLRIYDTDSTTFGGVVTRAQNPIGNDVAARIIRLRDNGIGTATVELDQVIAPGSASLAAQQGQNYMELEIYGNIVNGNPPYTGWGIREMQG
jgi:hypothetical protein